MKIASLLSKLLLITLAAANFACSGGGTGTDAPEGSAQKTETVSLEQELRDANVKYAASVNADVATIEAKYKELIGDQFPDAFSANFLKFLVETNPSFAKAEADLQVLDARYFFITLRPRITLSATNRDAEKITDFPENGSLIEEVEDDISEEQKQKMKDASDQFSAALVLSRNILIQSAAIYRLNLTATEQDSFAVPEKFLGDGNIPADLREIMTQPLFAASFKDQDSVFSFFEIFAIAGNAPSISPVRENLTRRETEKIATLGNYNFIPASENIFRRPAFEGSRETAR